MQICTELWKPEGKKPSIFGHFSDLHTGVSSAIHWTSPHHFSQDVYSKIWTALSLRLLQTWHLMLEEDPVPAFYLGMAHISSQLQRIRERQTQASENLSVQCYSFVYFYTFFVNAGLRTDRKFGTIDVYYNFRESQLPHFIFANNEKKFPYRATDRKSVA